MKTKKTVKKALLSSVVALVVSFTMLLGTTFAWFTDSAESKGNIIQTGTLDVAMHWADGDEDPASATWNNAESGAIFGYANWEPGYVQARHVKISNVGSLALKYRVRIIANGEVSKLADVIDVYYFAVAEKLERAIVTEGEKLGTLKSVLEKQNLVNGELAKESDSIFTLVLKMREEAGNEYKNMTLGCDFSVQVMATQLAAEEDSFGKDYDDGADYDGEISSAESLAAAFVSGGSYKVVEDVTLDSVLTVPAGADVELELAGNTLTGSVEIDAGAALTVANGAIENTNDDVSAIQTNGGDLTLDNVVISSARHGVRVEGGNVIINSGEYKVAPNSSKTLHALNVSDGGNVIINGGTFVGPRGTMADSGAAVNVQAGSSVVIYGGNFSGGKNNTLASKGSLTVYGGIFDQDPSKFVAPGYEADAIEGGFTVSIAIDNQDEIKEAISNAQDGDTILLDAGTYNIASSAGKDLTFVGTKDTIIETSNTQLNNNLTFEGVTIKAGGTYKGFTHTGVQTYKNVTINGEMALYGDKVIMEGCTINLTGGQYLRTYGAEEVELIGCTFNTDGKALLVYKDGGYIESKITVTGCTFNATASGYAGNIANHPCAAIEIDNYQHSKLSITTSGNTVSEFFSGEWRIKKYVAANGAIEVNGESFAGMAMDGKYIATSNANLESAINSATGEFVIYLAADIVGDVTATQKPDVKVTIDGDGHKFSGVLLVDGKSARYDSAALTIKNVNFEADSLSADAYIRLGNGTNATRYTNHVTVENCTFKFSGSKDVAAVKSYTGGDLNLTIDGCTAYAGMHSLAQLYNIEEGLTITNCFAYSKNGVNMNSTLSLEMSGCTFEVRGYAIRFGASGGANTTEKIFNIKDSTLKSACEESDDAVIIFRGTSVFATLNLVNTTLEGSVEFKGNTTQTTINR